MSSQDPMGARITQVAIIVRDLQATMESYHRIFGWGPWRVYEFGAPFHHDVQLRGKPVNGAAIRMALVDAGGVDLELIEPLSSHGLYREFLDAGGEGVHHIMVRDARGQDAALTQRLRVHGVPDLVTGRVGADIAYTYHDAVRELGATIETIDWQDVAGDLQPTRLWPPEPALT